MGDETGNPFSSVTGVKAAFTSSICSAVSTELSPGAGFLLAPVKVQAAASAAMSTAARAAHQSFFGFFAMSTTRSRIPFLLPVMVVAERRIPAEGFLQVRLMSVRP